MVTVIYITKDKLIGARVKENKLLISDNFELGWDANTFDISLGQIIEKLKSKNVRILLDNSLSYTLRLTIPFDLSHVEERRLISDKIKEKIPEVLRDEDWDYKEIQFNFASKNEQTGGKEKEVIVFSPVKHITELLRKAKVNLNFEIEAVEPVEIAQTRNANPVIGIALKDDIKGSDKDVLNISLEKGSDEGDFKEVMGGEKPAVQEVKQNKTDDNKGEKIEVEDENKPGAKKVIFTAFLILVILTFVSVLGFFIYRDFFAKKDTAKFEPPQITPTETPQATNTPTPEEESIDLTQYKINVRNGSGIAGEAQSAVSLMAGIGFSQFETGNADSYGYLETEVSATEDFPQGLLEKITDVLDSEYNVSSGSAVLESSDFDVEVIVGARK